MLSNEDIKKFIIFIRSFIENLAFEENIENINEKEFIKNIDMDGIFISLINYESGERILYYGYPKAFFPFEDIIKSICVNIFLQLLASNDQIQNILKKTVFELTFIKNLECIKVDKPIEYIKKINVIKEGIIVQRGFYIASILPQVALENKWDAISALAECSMNAGLPADIWMRKDTNVYKFQVDIYKEVSPYGKIIKIEI
jgi:uncharacterized protein (TIGR00296 family)